MSQAVAKCAASPCPALLVEEAKLKRLRPDGLAAAQAYNAPGDRTPPPGYHEATPAELKEMNLKPEMLEHPKNAKGEVTDFRAAVFVNNKTGERIIAFKGTDTGADWGQNFRQGAGRESYYYTQAQTIANNVAASSKAGATHFTGHSLGGGLASAASRASGLPASTFNAASLHKDTVPQPNLSGVIDAVSVRGDPLTRANEGMLGTTSGTRPYKLEPPDYVAEALAKKIPWYNLKDKAVAFKERQLMLHGMKTANDAMEKRARQVDAAIKANHCR